MNQFPNIPGFPGAPAPQPAAQPGFAPAGFPAGFPNPAAPPVVQPGYAPPQPGYVGAPPGFAQVAPAAAPQAWQQPAAPGPEPLPDLGAVIAAATMGTDEVPRITDQVGDYRLEVVKSGRRKGQSKKDQHPYDALYVEARVISSTSAAYPVGTKVSDAFDLLGMQQPGFRAGFIARRLKEFSAGIMQIDFADPRVPQVYPMIAGDQLVGRQIDCEVSYGKNMNPKTGKPYADAHYRIAR